jgi:hypothetical protein
VTHRGGIFWRGLVGYGIEVERRVVENGLREKRMPRAMARTGRAKRMQRPQRDEKDRMEKRIRDART